MYMWPVKYDKAGPYAGLNEGGVVIDGPKGGERR